MDAHACAPSEARSTSSVMVIDDDDDVRSAVNYVLRDAGYQVQLASNGREALDLLEHSHAPDLIVLDLVMPHMDGWEFRVEQRRDPRLAEVPVLVLSADSSHKARAIDADGWLPKPLDSKSFLHAVELGLLAAERRKLEQRAAELDRLSSIGVLAAGIAHEINNPLAVVSGNVARGTQLLESLRDHPGASSALLERALSLLAHAQQGADRIAQVVRAVATFSHPLDTRTSVVDLCAVLGASIRLVTNEARHRAQLTTAIDDGLHVLGNGAQLGQVFVNLLTNAAHAIDEGNPLANAIHVTARRTLTERIVVEVTDTGRGIRPEQVGRVFDPFFSTGTVGQGMGLGLAVSQRLVAAAGGRISVRSVLGEGSCFRVELPSCPAPRPSPAPPAARPEPAGRRPRVLVIDDEELMCEMLAGMLEESFDVTWFSNPRAALEALRTDASWDVVLSDVMMPELSGMDLHAEVARSLPALAQRFVFITGGTFTARAQAFLETLPREPLLKPFSRDALLARVRAALAQVAT
ncbi:MAG: response regulator [Polyangiales bacterium]